MAYFKRVSIWISKVYLMKASQFRIRVEKDLHLAFLDACKAVDTPAAQVIRRFMRQYVENSEACRQQSLFEQSVQAGLDRHK